MDRVGYGIIGSGFIADLHAARPEGRARGQPAGGGLAHARARPAASPTSAGIPHAYQDYRELLARPDIQLVSLALPNDQPRRGGHRRRPRRQARRLREAAVPDAGGGRSR